MIHGQPSTDKIASQPSISDLVNGGSEQLITSNIAW
jgi:hypothetical protein